MLSMPRIVRPDLSRIRGIELVPPLDRQLVDLLSETKNWEIDRRRLLNQTRCPMDYSVHSIIWVVVIGLVVGAIAKLLMPGKDPGGCIITILLGIAGAFVGTWIGRLVTGNETYTARWIMSIVGAMLLLLLYRLLFRRRQ